MCVENVFCFFRPLPQLPLTSIQMKRSSIGLTLFAVWEYKFILLIAQFNYIPILSNLTFLILTFLLFCLNFCGRAKIEF